MSETMKARENLSAWMAERARGISDAITGGAFLDAYTALIRQEEQAALRPLVEAVRSSEAELRQMCAEVWSDHRSPASGDYNECEVDECSWCERTKRALAALSALALPEEK